MEQTTPRPSISLYPESGIIVDGTTRYEDMEEHVQITDPPSVTSLEDLYSTVASKGSLTLRFPYYEYAVHILKLSTSGLEYRG